MPPPPPNKPLANPAAAPASRAVQAAFMPPPPFYVSLPGGPGKGGKPFAYFSLKLWQSVHSTMVGLVSWVPTWMVFRPQ